MLRRVRSALILTALAAPLPALAATTTPVPAAASTKAVDQRIDQLHKALGITAEQAPLWDAFAQAMRDNAASTEQLFQQRADATANMNAEENMHSYAQLARTYADDIQKLSTAFDSLYASLSPTQKQAADTLFRQQSTDQAKAKR